MKKSLKVLFFGNERIATGISTKPVVFKSLASSRHEVVGLVVHASDQTSRTKRQEPIVELAESLGLPVINPEKLSESTEQIKSFGADIGVLVAYGKIIPQVVLDIFPHGVINLHPSALPKLRGSTPLESTILAGDPSTAVSVMKLVPKMDAGPVLSQKQVDIPHDISKQKLAEHLQSEGAILIHEVLDQINESDVREVVQDENMASYCSTIQKSDGLIDWTKPAVQIVREVRAYAGWPTSYFENMGNRFVVMSADDSSEKIADMPGTVVAGIATLGIQTGDGVVWITSIKPAGKKEMSVKAFLNGYRTHLS